MSAIASPRLAAGVAVIPPDAQSGLKILVIQGEDAINVIQRNTAVAPIVEVRDRNDVPVAGALVTFTIEGGKGAAFGGASTLTVATNAAGQATATGFSSSIAGAIQINVQATFQGQVAAATIAQTNVLTAAEAAAASGGGSTGTAPAASVAAGAGAAGLGLSGTTLGIIGGAAAAAAGAAVAVGGSDSSTAPPTAAAPPPVSAPAPAANRAPVVASVTASRNTVLVWGDSVTFTVSATDQENDPLTFQWDFGDGSTSTDQSPRYTYTREGVFNARVTVSDGRSTGSGQTTLTVRSVTGLWRADNVSSNFGIISIPLTLSQNGSTLSGTSPVITGPTGSGGPGTLTGSVNANSPRVNMVWVFLNDGTPGRTTNYVVVLEPSEDLNTMTGTIGGGLQGVFRRQ